MRLLVVSDLHIWGSDDPVYRSLLTLIQNGTKEGDTLILAGDVFDLFVGNKEVFVNRYREFFDALRDAGRRQVELHYIEGNHDFLMRKAFSPIPGMRVHSRDVSFQLRGKRFFVAHGDLVDRSDYRYLALRSFLRSPVMKAMVAAAPGRWLDRIGKTSSKKSRANKPTLPSQLSIERLDQMRLIYRNYAAEKLAQGFDFVVLGHCHDLDEKRFKIGGRCGQYINMGYPRVHKSFLVWSLGDDEVHREPLPELE